MGNATQYNYDLAGQTTAVTNASNQTTAYAYDPMGRLIQVTDPLTGTTAYEYDAVGNLATITDANGNTAEVEAEVYVPHDQGHGMVRSAGDDGYTVTPECSDE